MNVILHHKGAYQIYSTISDAPLYERALTREELEKIIRREQGAAGVRDLPARLKRAHDKGTSNFDSLSLSDELLCDRAGPDETSMSVKKFIAQYLTHNPTKEPA